MATLQEVESEIKAIAAKIIELKAAGGTDPAAIKQQVAELLAAKENFADLNGGVPYDPPKADKKKVKGPAKTPAPERAPGEKSKKEMQREMKKAQKEAAKKAAKTAAGGGGSTGAPPAAAAPSSSMARGVSNPVDTAVAPPPAGTAEITVQFCAAMPPTVAYAACSLTQTNLAFSAGEESLPCLRLPDGRSVSGDLAIARYVARSSGATAAAALLGGADPVEASVVDQWLDLSQTRDLVELAGTLDAHLAPRTYLAGHELSLADIAVYVGLSGSRYAPPKELPHLSRWFSMLSGVKAVSSAKGAVMALSKAKGGKGKSTSRGLPGGGGKGREPGGGKKLVQGCPPLEGAVHGQVVTRFPPEPSGYLHIGHVKACLLNQYYAQFYGGKMIVRFDDTNPSKEKEEYAASIVQDLATLGIRADMVTYTSDRFEEFKEYALGMIKKGDAYMDDNPQEAMKAERMSFKASAKRDTPVKENLRLFELLLKGDKEAEPYCLRAKADYASVNGTMRDPVMYRMNTTPHHRTGTKHKAYPTYDFACPIIDSIEGVTHACRTTEYQDRDEQYAWFQEKLGLRKVVVHSYARMNFMRTVLSKRHLGWFVEEGRVEGWDDPRFPTVQGVIRRGVSPAALRDFMLLQQGASKKVTNMEWDKFWSTNKKKYEQTAHRYMGVFKDTCVELHIENAPAGDVVSIPVALHPKHPEIGQRAMRLSSVALLEGGDADALADGEEITLKNWGNVKIKQIDRDAGGKATKLSGEFIPNGDFKSTKKLTWLAKVPDLVPMVLVEFDYLVTKDKIEEGENFKDFLNPNTRAETAGLGDPGLRNMRKGDVVQLERRGFFRADKPYRGEGKPLVLFMIPDGKTQAMSTLASTLKHV
ncbi:unnamed protein product [Pylaiella littoralis]